MILKKKNDIFKIKANQLSWSLFWPRIGKGEKSAEESWDITGMFIWHPKDKDVNLSIQSHHTLPLAFHLAVTCQSSCHNKSIILSNEAQVIILLPFLLAETKLRYLKTAEILKSSDKKLLNKKNIMVNVLMWVSGTTPQRKRDLTHWWLKLMSRIHC